MPPKATPKAAPAKAAAKKAVAKAAPKAAPKTPLGSLREAFAVVDNLSYCEGTLDDVYKKNPSFAKLFYNVGKESQCINFAKATTLKELKALADACPKATFGKNDKDVLDDNYRKAGKMDTTEFATLLSPATLGLLDIIASNLFRGKKTADNIECQLYKLNVYGPGSFFKPHVDTPRGRKMIGTLVLVLPTKHEGGGLQFNHSGQEWTFESAEMLAEKPKLIAYVAFAGDMQHEVLPVVSGYRVTLTYNLYEREEVPVLAEASTLMRDYPGLAETRKCLATLLKDQKFLPEGGLMAFGLSHRYPFERRDDLKDLQGSLKGPDAVINDLCQELGIEVSLKAVYHNDSEADFCLLDTFVSRYSIETDIEDEIMDTLTGRWKGTYCRDIENDKVSYSYGGPFTPVVWIKPRDKSNALTDVDAVVFGNESTWITLYGEVCLVAKVAPAGDRQSVGAKRPAAATKDAAKKSAAPKDAAKKPAAKKAPAKKAAAEKPPAKKARRG